MSENRLRHETSPYLLQHRDNPVHWWAWGPPALAEANRTGKPILLSVGYAACHWCHVMAHESFEDAATAAVMNELFVNIKVDREERPDIDAIYMGALHRLGEHGGWPLTMFLDAGARPFWGGTYFPPAPRYGKPSFVHVLREVARIYREEPGKVAGNAGAILAALTAKDGPDAVPVLSDGFLADFTNRLLAAVDREHGGLKGAPKFPQWSIFWLLWRGAIRYANAEARTAVENTLVNICQGGIYDHLGGGFSRYSVDDRWLVPHFEKMLYDNALLIDLMTEVWRETKNPLFAARIAETVAWLEREMIADDGGFAASLDADSEGEEGKFYVWSAAGIAEILGADDARWFGEIYAVTAAGNFEGHTILNRLGRLDLMSDPDERRLANLRAKLLAHRAGRVRPGWDDKVLADWNGLMIAALARAADVFEQPRWLAMAERAFACITGRMQRHGRLLHSRRAGKAVAPATAADYANMIAAALRLYQATNDEAYLAAAEHWTATLDRHYWIAGPGGYAMTADDTTDVIVRLCNAQDDAVPNANGTMISNLAGLFLLTGNIAYFERAGRIPQAFGRDMAQNLVGHCGLAAAMLDLASPATIVVIGGEKTGRLVHALYDQSLPGAVERHLPTTATFPMGSPLAGKSALSGAATLYACVGPQCSLPATDPDAARTTLRQMRTAPAGPAD